MTIPKKMNVDPTTRPLRIAVIYSRNPLPMRRADQMTVAHLLAFLKARGHEVDLHCIDAGGSPDESERKWLSEVCNVYVYSHNITSIITGLLKVPLRLLPVQVGLFSHPKQARNVRALITKGVYDVVYTYYIRSAEIARDMGRSVRAAEDKSNNKPVTFMAYQLSQTLNSRRIAKNAPNLIYKIFYEIESRLLARYESRIWKHFTRSVLIGKKDVEEVQNVCRANGQPVIDNYVFGAHGTDVSRFTPRHDVKIRPGHLVFSGVMRTPTNIHAVQWFAANVWPLIRAARPETTWSIVGREPSAEVRELASLPGVEVTGTVPDTSVPIAEAAICINPMKAGGGMQNKLIEYMASGKAVVATSVANEGIEAPDNAIVVVDGAAEFADAVLKLLESPGLAAEIGERARDYVLKEWTWEAHFLKLENNFYSAIDN